MASSENPRRESTLVPRALLLPAVIAAAWLYHPFCQDGPVFCLWRRLLGVECPGCGLVRAFSLCAHGRLAEAFAANPLFPAVFFVIAAISLNAAVRLCVSLRGSLARV